MIINEYLFEIPIMLFQNCFDSLVLYELYERLECTFGDANKKLTRMIVRRAVWRRVTPA